MNYSKSLIKDYISVERERLKEKFAKLAINKPNKDNNFLQINNWAQDADDSNMYLKQIIKDCKFYGIKYDIWNSNTSNGIISDDDKGLFSTECIPPRYGKEYNPVPTINITTGFDATLCLNDFNDVEGATLSSRYIPAVAKGIIDFIHIALQDNVQDKNVLIIGRGPTMGSRLIRGFMSHHANVMVAHSRTSYEQLDSMMSIADIIITATSVPKHVSIGDLEDISNHVFLIDAGTCFYKGKLVGNCDEECYDFVKESIGVPGGVGPLTRLALFQNIFRTMDEIGVTKISTD